MQYEKTYITTLNISNAIDFCTNIEGNIRTELNNKFVGKCFMGAYICSIEKLVEYNENPIMLRISDASIIKSEEPTEAVVHVKFTAKVVRRTKWDFVTGVKIASIDRIIAGMSENAEEGKTIAFLPPHEDSKIVRVNQIVTVRVVEAHHQPMDQHITAAGVLATCDRQYLPYNVRGSLQPEDVAGLDDRIKAIEHEMALRTKLVSENKAGLMYFEALLYSHATPVDTPSMEIKGADGTSYVGLNYNISVGAKTTTAAKSIIDTKIAEGSKHSTGSADIKAAGTKAATVGTKAPATAATKTGGSAKTAATAATKTSDVKTAVTTTDIKASTDGQMNILDLVRKAREEPVVMDGIWFRPLYIPRSSPIVCTEVPTSKDSADQPTAVKPIIPVTIFLKQIYDFLNATRRMTEIYNTPELIETHENIWRAMARAQVPRD